MPATLPKTPESKAWGGERHRKGGRAGGTGVPRGIASKVAKLWQVIRCFTLNCSIWTALI
jgi:hypothetical protein